MIMKIFLRLIMISLLLIQASSVRLKKCCPDGEVVQHNSESPPQESFKCLKNISVREAVSDNRFYLVFGGERGKGDAVTQSNCKKLFQSICLKSKEEIIQFEYKVFRFPVLFCLFGQGGEGCDVPHICGSSLKEFRSNSIHHLRHS